MASWHAPLERDLWQSSGFKFYMWRHDIFRVTGFFVCGVHRLPLDSQYKWPVIQNFDGFFVVDKWIFLSIQLSGLRIQTVHYLSVNLCDSRQKD